ncbi:MAG: hypothetical protein Q9O62_07565 [Ardenticatenia bacterium]|nr:hypothetical protein [Ardenticatenia bacterium]
MTNLKYPYQVCHYYRRRYRMETLSSGQKSLGFHLPKSHLAEPVRLSRLLMVACLAYILDALARALGNGDGQGSALGTITGANLVVSGLSG